MYCMACGKEYKNEMFCPECGRMLVSENTFDYQKKNDYKEKTYYEEQRERAQQIQQRKIEAIKQQQKLDEQNIPKCPTCGSTNIRRITATERGVNAVIFGVFGTKRKCQFECQNPNCKYRW